MKTKIYYGVDAKSVLSANADTDYRLYCNSVLLLEVEEM